jgi:hypothetical protein
VPACQLCDLFLSPLPCTFQTLAGGLCDLTLVL